MKYIYKNFNISNIMIYKLTYIQKFSLNKLILNNKNLFISKMNYEDNSRSKIKPGL